MTASIARRLEQYTVKRPGEVLLVSVDLNGQPDQIAIFKGFSSSLMCPTAFDPDVPIISDDTRIHKIDRLESPYNPKAPRYIAQGLSWDVFEAVMAEAGV